MVRTCDDCTRTPLAYWKLDDCNADSTELVDSATSSPIRHPAFRAVSAQCVSAVENQGVQWAGSDDVVYSPDQPDYVFDSGLTVAAWINPDRLSGTQSLVRKRFTGSSSFVLALEGAKVSFALHLSNGRSIGVSAPVKAGRFTHVAATFDGQQAILYLNGVLTARASASGQMATGAGPILIGNDANGRRFTGTIDEIWLNTVAAPADQVMALTCVRKPILLSLTPTASPPVEAGTFVTFDVSLANQNSAACPVEAFQWGSWPTYPLIPDTTTGGFTTIAPGQTVHTPLNISSTEQAPVGDYPFYVYVGDGSTQVTGTYRVGNLSSCIRVAPTVTVTPLTSAPVAAGTVVPFDVAVTNNNSVSCKTHQFSVAPNVSTPLSVDRYGDDYVQIPPGETFHSTYRVQSTWSAPIGAYSLLFSAYDYTSSLNSSIYASYVVGTPGQLPAAVATPNGQLTIGSFSGYLWALSDLGGSTITLNPNEFCVNGNAIQVPIGSNGQPDWSGAWGALAGWNLNQPVLDGVVSDPLPADLSGKQSIGIQISGADGLDLRIQLHANDANGTPAYYCSGVPQTGAVVNLSSMMTDCWSGMGVAFDPATIKPIDLSVQVVTSMSRAYPFNFCVTQLDIQ